MSTTTSENGKTQDRGKLSSSKCIILSIPGEIFEMIIGNVSIVDLPALLSVSNSIRAAFNDTCYGPQLESVLTYERQNLMRIWRRFYWNVQFGCTWRLHDVLKVLTQTKCECGGVSCSFYFLSIPPKKVCHRCRDRPEYRLLSLKIVQQHYRLIQRDIDGIPRVRINDPRLSKELGSELYPSHPLGGCAIPLRDIEEVVQRRGLDSIPLPLNKRLSNAYLTAPPGFIVVGNLDPLNLISYRTLYCNICRQSSGLGHDKLSLHNYESLREHFASYHPERLCAFETGWQQLGPGIQNKWLEKGHRKPDTPEESQTTPLCNIFKNWSQVLVDELRGNNSSNVWNGFYHKYFLPLKNLIKSKQEHSGSYFGLPDLVGGNSDDTELNIAYQCANSITDFWMDKMIVEVKNDIEQNGLDAIRKYYPTPWPIAEVEGKKISDEGSVD